MSRSAPQDAPTAPQRTWLQRNIRSGLCVLALLTVMQAALAAIERRAYGLPGLGISLVFCGVLLWADRSVGRGRAARAANILSGSLPVVTIACALLYPEASGLLLLLPIYALITSLPLTRGPHRRGSVALSALAIAVTLVYPLVFPPPPPSPLGAWSIALATAVCAGGMLVGLVRFHGWFRELLDQADGANARLDAARAGLEAQVRERTAEVVERERAASLQADQRRRLIEVAQQMLSGQPLGQVYRQVGQALGQLFPYDDFAIFWLDPESGWLFPTPQAGDSLWVGRGEGFRLERGQGISGEAVLRGEALLVNGAHQDPRSVYAPGARPPVEHLIVVPLQGEGQIIGTLGISRHADPPYSDAEFEAAQLFGGILSLAVSNARLLEHTRASERKYRRLFEESIDAIYLTTPGGQVIDINPAGVELLGYSREELLSPEVAARLYADEREREEFMRAMRERGAIRGVETRRRHRDGRVIYVEESVTAVRDAHGNVTAHQGYLRDITARKQVEERLRQVLASARCLLWSAVVTDPEGRAVPERTRDLLWDFGFFNEAAAAQFFPVAQAPGQSYAAAWVGSRDPRDWERTNALSLHALQRSWPGYGQEYRYRRADGEERWLAEEVRITPLGQGRWELVGVCTDVTERKRAEEAQRESGRQLAAQVEELKRREAEITALHELGERLQACHAEREAYLIAASAIRQLIPAAAGAIYAAGPAGELTLVHSWGAAPPPEVAQETCAALGGAGPCRCSPGAPLCHDPQAIWVPLVSQGERIAALMLRRAEAPSPEEDADQRRLLEAALRPLELSVANLRLRERLQRQAIHDPLTGLYNRRYMEAALEQELHRVSRRGAPLGLIMLDVDHFKQVNDSYGHAAGDAVLRELGRMLLAGVRASDIACRYGGEEFILILPESSLADTCRRAERFCEHVRRMQVDHAQGPVRPLTISVGIAACPEHGATVEGLLYEADMALYRAKAQGRDRVVVAGPGALAPSPSDRAQDRVPG